MRRVIFGTLILFASLKVMAECNTYTCVDVYVDRLYPVSGGAVYVSTSGTEANLNCSSESGVYATLNMSKANAGIIYSTLLSAMMGEKKVQIRIVERSNGCEIMYVTLDRNQS